MNWLLWSLSSFLPGKLGEYSDANTGLRPPCPNIHPKNVWGHSLMCRTFTLISEYWVRFVRIFTQFTTSSDLLRFPTESDQDPILSRNAGNRRQSWESSLLHLGIRLAVRFAALSRCTFAAFRDNVFAVINPLFSLCAARIEREREMCFWGDLLHREPHANAERGSKPPYSATNVRDWTVTCFTPMGIPSWHTSSVQMG